MMTGTGAGFGVVGDARSLALSPGELRLVADRLDPTGRVKVELPQHLVSFVEQQRREHEPGAEPGRTSVETTPCTWTPDCPQAGSYRMERRDRPDLTVVETVCDQHREAAAAEGYSRRESGHRRASPGSDLTRDPPPG